MMTVFLLPTAKPNYICHLAREWCIRKGKEKPVCSVANYLFANCKVVAGHDEALHFIETNARDLGIKKYKRLEVSGAFHTNLMAPAQKALAKALRAIHIDPPALLHTATWMVRLTGTTRTRSGADSNSSSCILSNGNSSCTTSMRGTSGKRTRGHLSVDREVPCVPCSRWSTGRRGTFRKVWTSEEVAIAQ
uniref:[acyl-carrier-protein] S-malonyltransferase n=1 Tax=Alectorobius mimon TaxID=360319 RepID=A0A147B8T5_9ACAR